MRATVRRAAPDVTEAIKYGIPTFLLGGNLVHFGAFKTHVGFYPTPSGLKAFENDLSAYEGGKGSVRFPFDRPLPLGLIARMVKFRIKEVRQKAGSVTGGSPGREPESRFVMLSLDPDGRSVELRRIVRK